MDTDDGSDMFNATANVMLYADLWKADFGGHSKTYSKNVNILGRGCGPGSKPPRVLAYDPDVFIGNQCIGSGTEVTDCESSTTAVMHDNMYYIEGGNNSAVCPNKSATGLEHGSKWLPLPDNATIIKMAREALGMPSP